MEMLTVTENEKEGVVTIAPHKRFDFGVHREFRESYRDRKGSTARYVIDMTDVEYIDSSALGMLLLLREYAMANKGVVVIADCKPEIRKILAIANFDRLFEIK